MVLKVRSVADTQIIKVLWRYNAKDDAAKLKLKRNIGGNAQCVEELSGDVSFDLADFCRGLEGYIALRKIKAVAQA